MDVAVLVGTGGPLAVLAMMAGLALRAYLQTLRAIRDQIVELSKDTRALQSQLFADLGDQLRVKEEEVQVLRSQMAKLKVQLHAMRKSTRLEQKRCAKVPSQWSLQSDTDKDLPHSGFFR